MIDHYRFIMRNVFEFLDKGFVVSTIRLVCRAFARYIEGEYMVKKIGKRCVKLLSLNNCEWEKLNTFIKHVSDKEDPCMCKLLENISCKRCTYCNVCGIIDEKTEYKCRICNNFYKSCNSDIHMSKIKCRDCNNWVCDGCFDKNIMICMNCADYVTCDICYRVKHRLDLKYCDTCDKNLCPYEVLDKCTICKNLCCSYCLDCCCCSDDQHALVCTKCMKSCDVCGFPHCLKCINDWMCRRKSKNN